MMQNGLFGHKEHVHKVSVKLKNTKIKIAQKGRFGRELLIRGILSEIFGRNIFTNILGLCNKNDDLKKKS